MLEHYWENISDNSYGIVILENSSYAYFCIYQKVSISTGIALIYCVGPRGSVKGVASYSNWSLENL